MKKMLWGFSACALIFSSCSQNEVTDTFNVDNVINFRNLNNSLTRAANETKSDYGVFALDGNTIFESEGTKFSDLKVDGTTNAYGKLVKWPTSKTLDFYAYAPQGSDRFTAPADIGTDAGIEYTVGNVADEDFTIAEKVQASSGTVAFKFHHMLAKVMLGKVELAAELKTQFTLEPADDKGYQIRLLTKSNKGKNDIKTLGDWTNVNDETTEHITSNIPGRPAYDYAASKFHNIMPRQGTLVSTGTYIQLCNLKLTETNGDGTNLIPNGILMMYRLPEGSTTDNAFKRGHRYTVNFTLGSDIKLPSITDPENPDVPGEDVLKDYILFTATEVNWVDEVMDITNSNVVLGEPSETHLNGLADGSSSVFPTISINANSKWDWSTKAFSGLTTAGMKCYLDFTNVTFNGNKIQIKLPTDFELAGDGVTGNAPDYVVANPAKVTITKQQ